LTAVYFFGAGVSKEAGVPTQKEIWERIVSRWQETKDQWMKEILEFAAYLNFGADANNIQVDTAELLTLIDLALEQNAALGRYDGENLRKIHRYLIHAMCDVLETQIEPEKMDVFRDFCRILSPEDTVITLNYDTVVDRIISHHIGSVSYGFQFSSWRNEYFVCGNDGKQLILKPHGSLNWLYCNCCNKIYRAFPKKEGPMPPKTDETCPWDGNALHEVIITPSFQKKFLVPQLHNIWVQCFDRIRTAREINFVGYSFPPGDIHIIYLIKRAVLAGGTIPAINVITPDSRGWVLDRCRRIFSDFCFYKMSFGNFFGRLKNRQEIPNIRGTT